MLLLTLLILGLSPIMILLFWWYYVYFVKFRALNGIPGPKCFPIIGNVIEVGSRPTEILRNFMKMRNEYGRIFKVFIGPEVHVFHSDPEVVEQILTSNTEITKSSIYDTLRTWIAEGLLISTGSKWKARRKLITPSFHFAALEGYVKTFDQIGNSLVTQLQKLDEKKPIDIYHYINLFALDVICETSMGKSIDSLKNANNTFVQAVNGYLRNASVRMFSSWKKIDFLYKFAWEYPQNETYLKVLNDLGDEVIQYKQNELKNSKEDELYEEHEADTAKSRNFSLIDRLLRMKSLSNVDVKEEVNTFIFEGHDTVTSGMSFAIYCLAKNPEIQEKVYKEAKAVFDGTDGEEITIRKLQQLEYLDLVIKESQRIYPTVPMFERKLVNDVVIKGQKYPKGTIMTVFIYGLHHSEDIFENPEKFDPDRFRVENSKNRNNFAYIPFSAGPRNCIGQKFAVLEMKLTISKLIRNFEFSTVPGHEPEVGVAAVLKSDNGVIVRVKNRLG